MALVAMESWPLWAGVLAVSYVVFGALYNVYLHPLRHYPGPKLWAASGIPYAIHYVLGNTHVPIARIHAQYGDIVRIGPSQLSYTHPDAWNEIKGHRKAGEPEHPKEPHFYATSAQNLLGADRHSHSRHRRVLAAGFSAKAMQLQQPLINEYIDLLFATLRAKVKASSSGSAAMDMAAYFNYTTFDIIGDLSFGSSFDCLRLDTLHPWVKVIFDSDYAFNAVTTLQRAAPPWVLATVTTLFPSLLKGINMQNEYAASRVDERMALGAERPDFIEAMVRGEGDVRKELAYEEIVQNARLLVIAGSETTATALSGAAYLLMMHPHVQRKLAEEVRGMFKSEEDIEWSAMGKLKYMLAVLDESMRLMPPVPGSFPRVCQDGGGVICGKYVPGGTALEIWQPIVFRSPGAFTDPDDFIPERWLEGEESGRFANDKAQVFQPFSVGPRNCIGKNLAYVEMRLILARLIWNYDLSPADDEAKSWLDRCKAYALWHKPPLNIRLTPAQRG